MSKRAVALNKPAIYIKINKPNNLTTKELSAIAAWMREKASEVEHYDPATEEWSNPGITFKYFCTMVFDA